MDLRTFLSENRCTPIRLGQSGADVYDVNGESILKYVDRGRLDPALFDTYRREALFYQDKAGSSYLPAVLSAEATEDGIILLLKKYACPDRSCLDEALLRKIARTLARVHTDCIPAFLEGGRKTPEPLPDRRIDECLSGWKSVLEEHPGAFDDSALEDAAEKISGIAAWHSAEEQVLTHGDFHWENLLLDENGEILVCDWQGVSAGGASGDLSFFMSRLGSDGVSVDSGLWLGAYADAVREITGRAPDPECLTGHIAAANVITTFLFWHLYLHGADEDRVREIYGKMAGDLRKISL